MEDLKKSFLVRGNNIVGFGGSGEENTIESISVNGVDIAPDENKNVDITVPSIDGLTKDADLATVAKSGNYEDLDNKPEIPSIEGLAKTTDIPTKVSQLENDSKYLSSIPEEYITETELNAKGYLTEHQDISGKVDKVEGKSLISDTEITRLASVDNYDDTDIRTELANKADTTAIPSKVSELTNDSNYQTAEQVNSTVTTEIAKVVADAPEDLNTLKEMSDWIAGHEDDASAMNSAISDNKTAITALQTGKADKSEIPTTVAELTDSTNYAKTTDIPTTLPANGGNSLTVNGHTVKSDVPENAVFTDTVYDDTEVQKRISDNGYGEVAGGKNLLNPSVLTYTAAKNIKLNAPPKLVAGKHYMISAYNKKDGTGVSAANLEFRWMDTNDKVIYSSNTSTFENGFDATESMVNASYVTLYSNMLSTFYVQLEEGSVATPYEPYFPSNKMLAEEVNAQNESLEDYGLDNKFANGLVYGYCSYGGGNFSFEDLTENDGYIGSKTEYSCVGGETLKILFSQTMEQITVQFNNNSFFTVNNVDKIETVIPSGVTKLSFYVKKNGIKISNIGYIGIYINNQIDSLKNDLDKLNSLPIGSIIQIEAAKDNIETTEQKYGWQYLGTSNIECNDGAVMLLVTNVYRKNN